MDTFLQKCCDFESRGLCRQQDAVVEQQGELIRFLQRRCDNLAKEVLNLQAREDRWALFCPSEESTFSTMQHTEGKDVHDSECKLVLFCPNTAQQ